MFLKIRRNRMCRVRMSMTMTVGTGTGLVTIAAVISHIGGASNIASSADATVTAKAERKANTVRPAPTIMTLTMDAKTPYVERKPQAVSVLKCIVTHAHPPVLTNQTTRAITAAMATAVAVAAVVA